MKTFRVSAVIVLAMICHLAGAAEFKDRLINLSTRASVGTSDAIMIAGFVIGAGGPKQVLVRAAGPALTQYDVPGVLADPRLVIVDSLGTTVASNDDWTTAGESAMTGYFQSVGAFPFSGGSKDSALVVTLAPGAYTAQVSGIGSTTGVSLVEVYDLTGPAKLINLSTRARVESGAGIVISGLAIGQNSPPRRLLIRASGPALEGYGVQGTLGDPAIAVISMSTNQQVASNDNWNTGTPSDIAQTFAQAGAFPFAQGSKDSALVTDLPQGNYTIQVSGVGGGTGVSLVEVYDLASDTNVYVTVKATVGATDTSGSPPGIITFTRTGNLTQPLTVNFSITGNAVQGTDVVTMPTSVTFPAGVYSVDFPVIALPKSGGGESERTVTVTLTANPSYILGSNNTAGVTVLFGQGTLYVANLRVSAGSSSTAYGTATIRLTPSGSLAVVNVNFSGLSSPQVTAHLAVGRPGEDGPYVHTLPDGQVESALWGFAESGLYTSAALIQALRDGLIYVSIDTANFPNGELRGNFILSSGSQAFVIPPDPPPVPGGVPTSAEAARFLTQTTFGPVLPDVDSVIQKGYSTWINEQMAATPSLHRQGIMDDWAAFPTGGVSNNTRPGGVHRQSAWWKIALSGQDQLRQRVAFALSQIFVISDTNGTINNWQEGAASYYDIFVKNAFGNYRQILEEVTLSPMMGIYLSHLRNGKSVGGTFPDENYAREVMQLFTVGLNQLQPDGSLKLDTLGRPIPTYNQTTITETAKVFTGWAYFSTLANPNFRSSAANYIDPMMIYPAFHEDSAKTIIGGITLPASQGGVKDLKDTLDALFYHTNNGPFISRQLIQRLVSSNPSPGYVYRVAKVFENNGSGVRGDMGAVVRAILLDYEARGVAVSANPGFGKPKEPLLRMTALLRAFNAVGTNGRYPISNPQNQIAQAALRAPTVFNFFEPDYVVPGALAAAGLFAPEFQILTDTTAITTPNYIYSFLFGTVNGVSMNYTDWLPLAPQPQQLIDRLDLHFAAGSTPQAMRDRITTALNALPGTTSATDRVRTAAYLMVTSPEASIQK